MLIVIPVYGKEVSLATKLAAHIEKMGGVKNHSALLVTAPSSNMKLDEVKGHLKNAFAELSVFDIDREAPGEWPEPCNFTFSKVVEHLRVTGNKLPWFFFEVDNTPMVPTWADELEAEYRQARLPYMGVSRPAKIVDALTGNVLTIDGEFVVGSMIYPPDFHGRSILWKYLTPKEPWDVYIRWEVRPKAHVTEHIVFNRKSENYTRTSDGRIACDPVSDDSITDPVPSTTLVVHGCKDGSLIDLLNTKPSEAPTQKAPKK